MDEIVLHATERRVLGVLIEKGLTTPEYYPLTVNALVAGCNQKNNRDPPSQYDEAQVNQSLKSLEQKELVLSVIGDTGRVTRWRQELVRKLELSATELAILGELLLRGAQSEGDLRSRASRMRPIESLESLREALQKLRAPTAARPALVVRLSAEDAQRGVRWTHALYPKDQLEQLRANEPKDDAGHDSRHAAGPTSRAAAASAEPDAKPAEPSELKALLGRLTALEERVLRLETRSSEHPRE